MLGNLISLLICRSPVLHIPDLVSSQSGGARLGVSSLLLIACSLACAHTLQT